MHTRPSFEGWPCSLWPGGTVRGCTHSRQAACRHSRHKPHLHVAAHSLLPAGDEVVAEVELVVGVPEDGRVARQRLPLVEANSCAAATSAQAGAGCRGKRQEQAQQVRPPTARRGEERRGPQHSPLERVPAAATADVVQASPCGTPPSACQDRHPSIQAALKLTHRRTWCCGCRP